MAEENINIDTGNQAPSDQQQAEQEAINRYHESQKTQEEKANGVPDGYNEDGTPKEELIAGKFKSQEDLLKAYNELEKKLGQPKEPDAPAGDKKETEVTNDAGESFTVTKYEQEVLEKGNLSEDSYKELEKKGFTRKQVDQYIQGQRSYADGFNNNVYSSVGGQEAYTDLITWAADNIDAGTISDYNTSLAELDQQKTLRTLEYMKLKFDQANPKGARRIEGDSGGEGMQPFKDKNEWQRAMTNRLYGKDAKYTKMVDTRYLTSRKRGIL